MKNRSILWPHANLLLWACRHSFAIEPEHRVLAITDDVTPSLTRYGRGILSVIQ